jgi:tetratricopeptide (TPR) repeat protein
MLRWLIMTVATVVAFLITWVVSAVLGAGVDVATAFAGLAAAVMASPLSVWAAQERIGGVPAPPEPAPIEPPPVSPTPRFLIRVGDVPQRPPAFQPRMELFEQITAAKPVTVVQALTGARGVGKTQLAAEYARKCIDERRPLVAWIPAEEPGQAMAGLTELAEALGLRNQGEDATSAVRKVRRWLETSAPDHCLVVFDNAVDLDTLRPMLPAAGPARIVITSNHHAFADLGAAVNVDVFTPNEAATFLRTRIESADEAGARSLAEAVGRLPLALAQSAGVIRREGLSYDTFLARLREQPVADSLNRGSDPYPLQAAQAVLLALSSAEAANPLARPLLDLLAVLSADGVPRELLHAAGERRSIATGRIDAALGGLREASLIMLSIEDQWATMHRFTQQVVRDRARHNGTLSATIATAAATVDHLREDLEGLDDLEGFIELLVPREKMAAKANLIQQVAALWERVTPELLGKSNASLIESLLYLRLLMARNPETAAALLTDHVRLLGNDHVETLICRAVVADLSYKRDEVFALLEQNLAEWRRIFGSDNLDTLNALVDLANAYRDADRFDEAIALYEEALMDCERILKQKHPRSPSRRFLSGPRARLYLERRIDDIRMYLDVAHEVRDRGWQF